MKKLLVIIIGMVMVLSLMGCGKATTSDGKKIDIDLSTMSSTMVYSKVYEIMSKPDVFEGKRVKMRGLFNYYKEEQTGNELFACVIQDATACCAQGIEFELKGDYKYPDDYPELEREITLVGVMGTTEADGNVYPVLKDAEIKK